MTPPIYHRTRQGHGWSLKNRHIISGRKNLMAEIYRRVTVPTLNKSDALLDNSGHSRL